MKFETTPLAGLILIQPEVHEDARGFFLESWNRRRFQEAGLDCRFVQDNHSRSNQGTLRGMHFQTRQTQAKLVRVGAGAVFDAVVDLRRSSPSFGQWYGVELSAENQSMLLVPEGFAHGFYVLSESTDFLYKTSDYYLAEAELSLRWDDTTVGIQWPLASGSKPVLSVRDQRGLAWEELPYFA